jgi:hypothetical protein
VYSVRQIAAQCACYAAAAALLGVFSAGPVYRHADPELALLRLSFQHSGDRVRECRRLTQEELEALAPNMRRPLDCPRERVPLLVELEVDGTLLYRDTLPPSGIAGDGSATAYAGIPIGAGRHRLAARLRDSRRTEGFDYADTGEVDLAPGEVLLVDFDKSIGGFTFIK